MKKKSNCNFPPLGYKEIPDTNIFVNKNGRVWNNGIITIPKKIITPNGKITLKKAIEMAFKPPFEEKEVITHKKEIISTKRLKRTNQPKLKQPLTKTRKLKPSNKVSPQEYKKIPQTEYYINNEGKVWRNGRLSFPTTLQTQYGQIRIEKIVLWLFKDEKPRMGTIIHLDGNNSNKSVQNLKYSRLILPFEYEQINYDNLTIAIRSFCNISQKENMQISNIGTRLLLNRTFSFILFMPSIDNSYYQIFKHWINNIFVNPKTLAELFKLSIRDIHIIRNHYLNEFTAYIVQLNRPLLPYHPTKREQQKQLTQMLHSMGVKRPKKLSLKQALKKWENTKKNIEQSIEENKSTNNEPQ